MYLRRGGGFLSMWSISIVFLYCYHMCVVCLVYVVQIWSFVSFYCLDVFLKANSKISARLPYVF
jgi:hypothetical protein